MIDIKIKNGYDLKLAGLPSSELIHLEKPKTVAAVPERIPYIKPRLLVREGESVLIGSPLFEDKKDSRIKFLSPGSGKIESIHFGRRRVVKEIVINLDPDEKNIEFQNFDETLLRKVERKDLINCLLSGGIWPLVRELPFKNIADPDFRSDVLWVSLDRKDPFQPASDVYLKGNENLFRIGIKALSKLVGNVYVCASSKSMNLAETYRSMITHHVLGNYPADDPGVMLYSTKKSPRENRCWYINGQDVLLVGEFLKTGRYPVKRTISIGGNASDKQCHYRTRIGIPLQHAIGSTQKQIQATCISGGVFSGHAIPASSYLGFYETSINLIDPDKEEFFGFLRPGIHRASFSRTFLSYFSTKPLKIDSGLHGEERACVNCGTCLRVCPVDILPQFTYKSILAGDVEESLSHGLLDCVECGLCTFVCPSKVELCETLKVARRQYYKDMQ